MGKMRNVFEYDFDLAAGTAATNVDLPDLLDMSNAKHVSLYLRITKDGSGADAADTFDLYLQEADEGQDPVWSDRAHFPQYTADGSVSSTAPELYWMQIDCDNFNSGDAIYEPSGSAGGSHIAADTVINGPMKPPRRVPGLNGGRGRYRLRFEVTDTDADSDWGGQVHVFMESRV